MRKRISTLLMMLAVLLSLPGCRSRINPDTGGDNTPTPTKNVTPTAAVTPSPTPTPTKPAADLISQQINKMTLDEKIGQMVFAGVDGYTNNEHSTELISKYHVGGFILLKQNVQNTQQVVNLLNSLKKTNINSGNKIPLFLGVDEEGGVITRMPGGFTRLPTNKNIGTVNNSAFSYQIGRILGGEVNAFGYNMDFAPVLDINSNPNNPVIGARSFGTEPGVVTKLGMETMKGIKSQGIISAVKHFPGHGDTSVDSHTGLPRVNYDLNHLKNFELIPFAKAIEDGVDMVMAAHILFPKIDSEYPASMSHTMITGVLRNQMNFGGVVITDDMTMGAIMKNYAIGDAAVKSVQAGIDIILVCHEFSNEAAVINALKAAVKNGKISEEDINNSVYRILKLKSKYNLADKSKGPVDVSSINASIDSVLKKYYTPSSPK